jgi:hypothetical protein
MVLGPIEYLAGMCEKKSQLPKTLRSLLPARLVRGSYDLSKFCRQCTFGGGAGWA